MKKLFLIAVCLISFWPAIGRATPAADPLASARAVFEQYVVLERAFNPAVADLYSDDALIRNTRASPNEESRVITLPAPKYKAMIRDLMPVARKQGDYSTYSNVTYTLENDGVRITATRYSEMKKYSSPLSLYLAASPSGQWLIYEELSETQPD